MVEAGHAQQVIFIIIIFCIRTALGMALDTTFQADALDHRQMHKMVQIRVFIRLCQAMGGEVFPTSGRTSAQAQKSKIQPRSCKESIRSGTEGGKHRKHPMQRRLKLCVA